jgi:hypothetical protein
MGWLGLDRKILRNPQQHSHLLTARVHGYTFGYTRPSAAVPTQNVESRAQPCPDYLILSPARKPVALHCSSSYMTSKPQQTPAWRRLYRYANKPPRRRPDNGRCCARSLQRMASNKGLGRMVASGRLDRVARGICRDDVHLALTHYALIVCSASGPPHATPGGPAPRPSAHRGSRRG